MNQTRVHILCNLAMQIGIPNLLQKEKSFFISCKDNIEAPPILKDLIISSTPYK